MDYKEELLRRIELKRQLIKLTEDEIEYLESQLNKTARIATEKGEVTAPAV